jgi:hypothetical protein
MGAVSFNTVFMIVNIDLFLDEQYYTEELGFTVLTS